MAEARATNPRTISGEVIAANSDKTVTMRVVRRVKHPLYKKIIGRVSRIHVHDENNEARVGDFVTAVECRPISKTKAFRLASVDTRAKEV